MSVSFGFPICYRSNNFIINLIKINKFIIFQKKVFFFFKIIIIFNLIKKIRSQISLFFDP